MTKLKAFADVKLNDARMMIFFLKKVENTGKRGKCWLPTVLNSFDKNGRKLSKRVENTVGKGEIACYEQFLLFLQCFQKTCPADR